MALKTASTLGFLRAPIVDKAGTASRDIIKWAQKIETKTNASLTLLGLNANTLIPTTANPQAGTLGAISGQTQHLGLTGQLGPGGIGFTVGQVPGTLGGSGVGFTLDNVPDGAIRFAVDQVDAAKLAIINFASAHLNKILDNIADGVTYQRFTRVAVGQVALPTALIGAGAAATNTTVVTGVLATDTIEWSFVGAPAAGYASLSIIPYVTPGNVNFSIGNPSAAGITPGAQTVNYVVIR